MAKREAPFLLALSLVMTLLASGCGGGREAPPTLAGGSPTPPAAVLVWDPPRTYADNSPLDPYRELDYYELHLRGDQNFTETDAPVAQIVAVTNILSPDGHTSTSVPTTEFPLNNLSPFIQSGNVYYIRLRAVGVNGLKSHFSPPIAWKII